MILVAWGTTKTIQTYRAHKLETQQLRQEIKLLEEAKTKTEVEKQQLKKDYEALKQSKAKPKIVQTAYAGVSEEQALDFIVKRESGGNPLAVNRSSGACGLGQSLPCSKMLNALGVNSLAEASYTAQREWVRQYCIRRYGSCQKAMNFWLTHKWY